MRALLKSASFAILIAISLGSFAQSYKTDFYAAHDFLDQENFSDALTAFLKVDKDYPGNVNVKSIIGYCYLQSKYQKKNAIQYYLLCQDKLNAYYKIRSHKEENAPVESIWYLGRAYHANYQFDLALEKLREYKSVLDPSNTEAVEAVTRDIRISRNAKQLFENPVNAELHKLRKGINTEFPDYRPIISADERIMIFTSRRTNSTGGKTEDLDGLYREDVYVCYKQGDSWTDPEPIKELNEEGHEACIYISPDGEKMFIYRNEENGDNGGGTIYESKIINDKWSEPEELQAAINSEYWDSHAALSADGKTIAFVSDRPDGKGGRDIYLMKKLPSGKWADVQNIGSIINTPFDEEGPYLHPDGKTLYFSSKGHNTMGGFDVFASELLEDDTWSEPRNLGHPINTVGEDVFFVPSADGTRAYFSSFREGGEGDQDIYMIDMQDEKKKILIVYKGCIKDLSGAVLTDVFITVFDRNTDEVVGEYRANKTSGRFLFVLNPGNYKIEYEYNSLIAYENIDVAVDEEYHEIGRLVTKSDIKLEIQAIEADCEGLQIVQTSDSSQWKYQLLVNDVPQGGVKIDVLDKNELLVYADYSSEIGEFKYQPIEPEDNPLFLIDLPDPSLCGKAKILLVDANNIVLKEYSQNIRCKKEVLLAVEPASFQKFYGYNIKGVTTEENAFEKFINEAADIYQRTGKLTVILEGSASYVPTKTFKSNRILAAKRAEDGEASVKAALKAKGVPMDKVAIDRTSKVQGPKYKGDFESGTKKYGKYQYFKATAK